MSTLVRVSQDQWTRRVIIQPALGPKLNLQLMNMGVLGGPGAVPLSLQGSLIDSFHASNKTQVCEEEHKPHFSRE